MCCILVVYAVQWFEDRTEQLNVVERDLQELHESIELLVLNRKGKTNVKRQQ